jgi:hypothetical protein
MLVMKGASAPGQMNVSAIGGYTIIDDYGEDAWTYCRKAVDELRGARGITDRMIPVDSKCYYWQRTR